MGRFFGSELRLVAGRRRNQMAYLGLAAVPVLIALAIYWSSGRRRGEGGGDLFSQVTSNGIFVAFAGLTVEMAFFLPMVVAMLCGDAISGEAHTGTLRYLLTVPISRTRLLLVKYAAIVLGCLAGTLVIAAAGVLIGLVLFGLGPVTTLSGVQIPLAEGLWRLVICAAYLGAGMAALGAVGLFFSVLTEQPIAAMVATVAFSTIQWILSGVAQLGFLHPWLLVQRWPAFLDVLRDPPFWSTIITGLGVDLAYAVVFLLAAWARFAGKDITS